MSASSLSIAMAGSGGAGLITAGSMLADAVGRVGWYAFLGRSVGAQIRGGETVSMLRVAPTPLESQDDLFDILLAVDWQNLDKYATEMPLSERSLIITDPAEGEPPAAFRESGARIANLPFKELAKAIPGGRANMIALGVVAKLVGVPRDALMEALEKSLSGGREKHLAASLAAMDAGAEAARDLPPVETLGPPPGASTARWNFTGNEAAALGAVRGGVRFVAAYPITPATELLQGITPMLMKTGGVLVQAEDELSCINQLIGASFGGVPSLTATAGPGLSLMMESLGLAVASETPLVVVDVMRGGPSTGIPAKSEQSDLNIALYGQHGDAPHLVLAANSVTDCLFTTQWAVHLSEKLQAPAIVLSDQLVGQTWVIADRTAEAVFPFGREKVDGPPADAPYRRYEITESGISPTAIPGTPGCQHTADGLEHTTSGNPSSQAVDHQAQSDKRLRKLTSFEYGDAWADIEGDGQTAILTWGSSTGAAREAGRRLAAKGAAVRLVSVRLISPLSAARLEAALDGVQRVLVVELNHSGQFYRYVRAQTDALSQGREVRLLTRPGPLPIRPGEIVEKVLEWT